ncbi:ATP-grasp domain-containing protein [Sansalvadorimonas sp. 2012CJ34-2]|uniref:ATP-grasp domain-containing protein n=1 Tax=Parendozoicomonas callyspongiae TaxID=2942213 RepID=A0ABT0PFC9_9GAMM|nr:ATP-grasp domain-containing protein [Sansalvadorimonas sp. 2012CJ34-2]MCL6269711.1 ATP-grasp domain-containing protein [Sansalvadorimonas sp. 2012CJ34-2]
MISNDTSQEDSQLIEQAVNSTFLSKKAHVGMPPLEKRRRAIAFFEFWPGWVFYLPVAFLWLFQAIRYRSLTLPLCANPGFFLGGMVGEAKSDNFKQAGSYAKEYIAPWCTFINGSQCLPELLEHANELISQNGFTYPIIAKPDLGCRGQGVQIVRNEYELKQYLLSFPDSAKVLLQQLIPWEAEAGVFYIRIPGESYGRIFSLTLKYQPYVFGNGKDSLRTLIEKDSRASQLSHLYLKRHQKVLDMVLASGQPFRLAFAGSHSRGAIFRIGNHLITERLTKKFDKLCSDIDGFYYGRFDVRFADEASFRNGENFKVVEINGVSSEAAHIWDANSTLGEVYKTLFAQYNMLFRIGAKNRDRGFQPGSLVQLAQAWMVERKLGKQYPDTE